MKKELIIKQVQNGFLIIYSSWKEGTCASNEQQWFASNGLEIIKIIYMKQKLFF